MQRFYIKKDASHSTICFNDCRGIAERASFGRIFHSLKGKIHGSIFLFLLGYALGFAPLQPFALADFGTSDSVNLRQINDKLDSTSPVFLIHTSGQLDSIKTSLDTLNGVFTTDVNWITGRHQSGSPLTGVVSQYSILQQLELLRRISIATTNELRRLNVTNDYTQAFSNMIHSIETLSTNFIPLNTSSELIVKNLGYLADGYALEDSDGNAYDNRISATHWGNSSITMNDALQFIAQGVGGIDSAGNPHLQSQALIPLINTILGWTGGISDRNIQTNGIIGLLRQANKNLSELHSMTNQIVDSIEMQTQIISNGFAKVCRDLLPLMANNQTNLMYLESSMYPAFNTLSGFATYLQNHEMDNRFAQDYINSLYFLPYYLCPEDLNMTEGYETIYGRDYIPKLNSQLDLESVRGLFYFKYGNMSSYEDSFSYNSPFYDENREGASNLVAEATMKTTNSIVRLDSQLMEQLLPDWDDFEGVEEDWKRKHGPSQEDLNRIKGYFDASMEESQQEVTFQFDLDFGEGTEIHTGEWNLVADDETIGGIKSAGNKFIKYGASTIKGILFCLFVWHMVEMSIAVINGDAVVG